MKTRYRLTMQSDAGGAQLAELTIQAELKLLVGRADLQSLRGLELEQFGFADAESMITAIVSEELALPEKQRKYFEVPFTEVKAPEGQEFTGRILDRIGSAFSSNFFARIEGSCPETYLVVGRPTNYTSIAVSDHSLARIVTALEADAARPDTQASAVQVIGLIIAAAAVGIEGWRLYREEQDRREREERQEADRIQRERIDKEQEASRCQTGFDSSGGPAADGLMDRMGSVA